jgi:hypothetical protein
MGLLGSEANAYGALQLQASQYGGYGNCGRFWGALGASHLQEVGPDEEGWYEYIAKPAPKGILLQFEVRRMHQSPIIWIGYANDLSPQFNIANLYWRYTGIGRHQKEKSE